ncbi:MAG: Tat pathway signal protein [Kiritimatiellia bacterium]
MHNAKAAAGFRAKDGDIRAVLLHLGYNMWHNPQTELNLNEALWDKTIDFMAEKKMNMLVVDVGEGLVFPSHPELAVKGSWTPQKLHAFVTRVSGLGIEVVPKLNFSATHDAWLGVYQRMVSTKKYYEVVKDVIRDTAEIFSSPRLFHLGWDEETPQHQGRQDYVVVRKGDLWWHDFLYTVKCTEDAGSRPWVWSDYGWHHTDYLTRCPKSVMQSNWYYDEALGGMSLDKEKNRYANILQLYLDLDKAGFDQIPCGSNWLSGAHKREQRPVNDSIVPLVKFCRDNVSPAHLKGFMMASWSYIKDEQGYENSHAGIELFDRALRGEV